MEVQLCQRIDIAQDLEDVAGTAGTVHMSVRCLKETHETPRQVEVVSQEPFGKNGIHRNLLSACGHLSHQ